MSDDPVNRESLQTMPYNLETRHRFTLSFSQCTSQGVVLKRRHFQYALLSGQSKIAKRMGSNDEKENPETNELIPLSKVGPAVKPNSSILEEVTSAPLPLLRVPRKYRMRDQYGDLLPNQGMAKAPSSDAWLPASHMSACNKLVLNVTNLKLETLNVNFRGPVTFSVDYIEISNGDQPGKYLLMIFESMLTVLEEATLEQMLTEIGRRKNLSNFYVKLTCEEASNRVLAHKHSPKELYSSPFCPTNVPCEITTLSVSDSEDDDNDLMACPSPNPQLAKTLVIYPPPPAKGGFSITTEDLSCLEEGKYLNDVIMDFYLKYLVCEKLQKEDANKCHVFSSFFYKSLTQNRLKDDLVSTETIQERRHNRVKTWTRHLDLFKKDFIFVPINQSAHWYLAVICFPCQASHCSMMDRYETINEDNLKVFTPSSPFSNPMSLFYRHQTSEQFLKWSASEGELDDGSCIGSDDDLDDVFQYTRTSRYVCKMSDTANKRPCILIMDSLNCGGKPTVVKVLQEYLEMEWRVKKGSLWSLGKQAMDGWSVQVPQQDNHTDCGIYVLQYVESFFSNPPRTFHPAMDLRDWFPKKLVKKKREGIKRLIFRLHQQQA